MLQAFKRFFAPNAPEVDREQRLWIAVSVLLIEIAATDRDFSVLERGSILRILERDFGLSPEYASEILALAAEERSKRVEIWDIGQEIHEHFDHEQRLKMMEAVWTVVYADGNLDPHEDRLARILSDLLKIRRPDMIEIRNRVKKDKGIPPIIF